MTRLLVTGFGPFPGVASNPTALLARQVAASPALRHAGIRAQAIVLTTRYAALETALRPALERDAPDCFLMLGVAARRSRVCVETRAINRASVLYPDAGGSFARTLALTPGEPPARRPALAAAPLVEAMARTGLAAKVSRDAGRYLCNAAYFTALGCLPSRPVLFVHVPMPRTGRRPAGRPDRRPTMAAMRTGLVQVAKVLAIVSRRNTILQGRTLP